MILKKLQPTPFAANCYIVGSETTKEGMVVDPGAGAEEILQTIKELGLNIKLIVITHGHIDHIGALKEVKEGTGAEVLIHTTEANTLHEPPPDRLLKEGDGLDIGALHFTILYTPGHTPGGICLLGEGVVFSGDTLFNLGLTGRTDGPGGNHSQLQNSINTKLMTLPDGTILCPGHGSDCTIGSERQWSAFLPGR